jgi:hypothetical protein
LAADQPVADTAFTFLAMTGRALLREHVSSMSDAPAAGRQTAAIASDVEIPAGDLG